MAALAFGSGPIGAPSVSAATAAATIEAAWLAGIRHFDTAPAYGDAERRLGVALRGLPRAEATISTKVGRISMARSRPYDSGSPADGEARFELRFVPEVDVIMIAARWTLADRSAQPLLDACHAHGVRVLAAAPGSPREVACNAAAFGLRLGAALATDERLPRPDQM